MGYTHYFTKVKDVPEKQWGEVKKRAAKILEYVRTNSNIALAFESDEPDNLEFISGDVIRFNGVGSEGHETFYIDGTGADEFQFCKTARKPYDQVVVAILCVVNKYAPDSFDIGSDGDASDWFAGWNLAEKVCGEKFAIPSGIRGAK